MDIVRNNPALQNTPIANAKASYALGELLEICAALVLAMMVVNWSVAGFVVTVAVFAAAVYLRANGAYLTKADEEIARQARLRDEAGFFIVNDRRVAVMKSLGADAAVLSALEAIRSHDHLTATQLRIRLEQELGPAHTDEKLPMILRYTRAPAAPIDATDDRI